MGRPMMRQVADAGGRSRLALLLLAALLLTACAPVVEERQRFFWPPPPAPAKIEYINFFQSSRDAVRGAENRLAEAILGREKPEHVFERPFAVASDGKGRLLVTDIALSEVVIFDLSRHELRTLKTTDGFDMRFRFPGGVAVGADGRVWVADSMARDIYRFGANEREQLFFGREHLQRPTGLAVDDARQRLYVADPAAHQVVVFSTGGKFLYSFGERGKAPGQFNYPLDLDLDEAGNLYVLDAINGRVQVFDPDGNFRHTFGELGTAAGSFQLPKSLALSPSGQVYVTDSRANRFVIFDLEGKYLLSVGGQYLMTDNQVAPGGFYLPEGIAVDANDAIWVVDSLNRTVHQFQYLNDRYLAEHPILPGQAPSSP